MGFDFSKTSSDWWYLIWGVCTFLGSGMTFWGNDIVIEIVGFILSLCGAYKIGAQFATNNT